MKNLFDQHISNSFHENLDDIHASDELKAKVLSRILSETDYIEQPGTRLTAIVPEYTMRKHSSGRARHRHLSWLLACAAVASAILVGTAFMKVYLKDSAPEEIAAENVTTVNRTRSAAYRERMPDKKPEAAVPLECDIREQHLYYNQIGQEEFNNRNHTVCSHSRARRM